MAEFIVDDTDPNIRYEGQWLVGTNFNRSALCFETIDA
jgi:hypothetical protein